MAPSMSYLVVEVVLAEPDGVVLLVQLLAPERDHGGVVVVLGVGVRLHRDVTQPSNTASETWKQKTMIRELGWKQSGEVVGCREKSCKVVRGRGGGEVGERWVKWGRGESRPIA